MSHDRDDWLWDGSGTPDPDQAHLEDLLRPLAYQGTLELGSARRRRRAPWVAAGLGAMAVLALAALALVWTLQSEPVVPEDPVVAEAGWEITPVSGDPCGEDCDLRPGQWLTTDAASSARLAVADIGWMDVAPDTRLRLVRTDATEHRLELARGRLDARVVAPPRLLVVETPGATAVDLGCAYTLEVDDDGAGRIEVTSGWVSLEQPGRSSLVVAGSVALTRPGHGPGTPWFADASPELVDALGALDFDAAGYDALQAALEASRRRDTLSLWHLLARTDETHRVVVRDRIISLVPESATLAWDRILTLDDDAMRSLFAFLRPAWRRR